MWATDYVLICQRWITTRRWMTAHQGDLLWARFGVVHKPPITSVTGYRCVLVICPSDCCGAQINPMWTRLLAYFSGPLGMRDTLGGYMALSNARAGPDGQVRRGPWPHRLQSYREARHACVE